MLSVCCGRPTSKTEPQWSSPLHNSLFLWTWVDPVNKTPLLLTILCYMAARSYAGWAWPNYLSLSKGEGFLWLVTEVKESCSSWPRRKQTSMLWTAHQGHRARNFEQPLGGSTVPSQQLEGLIRTSVQGNEFCNDQWSWKSALSPNREPQSWPTVDFSLVRIQPCCAALISDLQNYELINGYCFRLLSVW